MLQQTTALTPTNGDASCTWWQEESKPASAIQQNLTKLYTRPSVTTGATLPWSGKTSSSLGPPRAFYAGPSSLPTITVSSCQPGIAKLVCKQEPGTSALPPSPFAEPHADAEAGVEFERKEVGNDEGSQQEAGLAERQYQKQESMQSTSSTIIFEPLSSCPAGQVITTAQDVQGVMTAGGHTFKGTETNSWRAQHGFVQTSVQPVSHDTVVTSNSSLYPGPEGAAAADLKVGQKRRQGAHLPADESRPPQKAAARHRGLRSAPTKRYNDLPSQQEEELLKAASLSMDLKGTSSDLEEIDQNEKEQRRIRRRNNNRESAKRVREKRDADLKAVNDKIANLQTAQTQLLEHCASLEGTCLHLSQELQQVQSKWNSSKIENLRLSTEVEHLRKNVEVGEPGMAGTDLEPEQKMVNIMQPASMNPNTTGVADALTALDWDLYDSTAFNEQYTQDWQSW